MTSPDRRDSDTYLTPPAVVRPLLHELRDRLFTASAQPPHVLDAGAGTGNLTGEVVDTWPGAHVDAVEIRDECAPKLEAIPGSHVHVRDFLTMTADELRACSPEGVGPELVVMNPPFNEAEAFVRQALHVAPLAVVAVLLRTAFSGSLERLPFWQEHPPAVVRFVVPRPSFTDDPDRVTRYQVLPGFDVEPPQGKGATDLADYAWWLWPASWREDIGEPFAWYRWR